jgi:hypothetical protein
MRRPRLVRVRLDEEVVALLDLLPNKSEYIRRAILANAERTCPLCGGRRVVAPGVGEHFAAVLTAGSPPDGTTGSNQSDSSE